MRFFLAFGNYDIVGYKKLPLTSIFNNNLHIIIENPIDIKKCAKKRVVTKYKNNLTKMYQYV